MVEINTQRLRLIPLDLDELILQLRDYQQLERRLNLTVTENKLEGPLNEIMGVIIARVGSNPTEVLWHTNWVIILKEENRIIGNFGFKGTPDSQEIVEIGYEIIPAYQNQGYMTEAAQAALRWALDQPKVSIVTAQTLRTNSPSQRVLEKIGMVRYNMSEEFLYWKFCPIANKNAKSS